MCTHTSSFIVTIQCSISTQPSVCHHKNFKTTAAKQFFNCWKEWQVLVLVARWSCTHAWLWDRTPHRFWLFRSKNTGCKSPSFDALVFGLVWWKNSTLSVWIPHCIWCFGVQSAVHHLLVGLAKSRCSGVPWTSFNHSIQSLISIPLSSRHCENFKRKSAKQFFRCWKMWHTVGLLSPAGRAHMMTRLLTWLTVHARDRARCD